jgi:hypothetical protein
LGKDWVISIKLTTQYANIPEIEELFNKLIYHDKFNLERFEAELVEEEEE